MHAVEVPFRCPTCDLELRSEAEYTKHMRQEHMSTAVCELCGKECYSKVGGAAKLEPQLLGESARQARWKSNNL